MTEPEIVTRLKQRLFEVHGYQFGGDCASTAEFCRQLTAAIDRAALAHVQERLLERHGYRFAEPCPDFDALCRQLERKLNEAHPPPAVQTGGVRTIPTLPHW